MFKEEKEDQYKWNVVNAGGLRDPAKTGTGKGIRT